MTETRWRTPAYWTVTLLFAALMLMSAAMYLTGGAAIEQALLALGYPPYILSILGTAKLLGAGALVQTRVPMLREWAYAGFTINLIGAAASHVLAGQGAGSAVAPLVLLVLLAVSYRLKPVARASGSAHLVTASVHA